MTNVLSVDFDWIMAPCIELYNAAAIEEKELDELFPNIKAMHLFPDYKKYRELCLYLINICYKIKDKNHIIFARNHDEILDYINDKWKIEDDIHVYNIDHHHDCGYKNSYQEGIDFGKSCTNWVILCDKIKHYTWINNLDSDHGTIYDEVIKKFESFQYTSDINLINYKNFDYVFVCLSPGWVPAELFPLFDALEFMIKDSMNVNEVI